MQTQPATNLELQKWIARQHGLKVESAWIEQSRRMLLLAHEDGAKSAADQVLIPAEMLIAIKQALRHFGMLR
jgi:hypothetical protein